MWFTHRAMTAACLTTHIFNSTRKATFVVRLGPCLTTAWSSDGLPLEAQVKPTPAPHVSLGTMKQTPQLGGAEATATLFLFSLTPKPRHAWHHGDRQRGMLVLWEHPSVRHGWRSGQYPYSPWSSVHPWPRVTGGFWLAHLAVSLKVEARCARHFDTGFRRPHRWGAPPLSSPN